MKKYLLTAAAAAAAAIGMAAVPAAHAASPMKPGLWEITVTNDISGMPVKQPPVTVRQCYRPEDVKDPQRMVPRQSDPNFKCDTRNYKLSGDTATWTLACSGSGVNMTGKGSMTMKGDSYSGASSMEMNMAGKTMKMSQTMSGKRVGECPAGQK